MSLKEYIRNLLYSIARYNIADSEIEDIVNRIIKFIKKEEHEDKK